MAGSSAVRIWTGCWEQGARVVGTAASRCRLQKSNIAIASCQGEHWAKRTGSNTFGLDSARRVGAAQLNSARSTRLGPPVPSHLSLLSSSLLLLFSSPSPLPPTSTTSENGSRKESCQWRQSCSRFGFPFRLDRNPPTTFHIPHHAHAVQGSRCRQSQQRESDRAQKCSGRCH
jgi:hypothetical protein